MKRDYWMFDENGYYISPVKAHYDDENPMPDNVTDVEPPSYWRAQWTGSEWIETGGPPEPGEETLAAEVRAKRNALLDETDKTQLLDAPVTKDLQDAYATYRQTLRDLPQQPGFPHDIEWPEPPMFGKE